MKLPMRTKPLDIEPKGWGNDVKMVTLAYQQKRYREEPYTKICNLNKSKEILCVNEKVQWGLKIRSIDRNYAWHSTWQYSHEEWDEDLVNNVHDVMINHFHTIVEFEWNLKDEHNPMMIS